MKINNLSLIIILSVLIAVILSAGILLIVTLSGSSDPADTTAETTATTTVKTTKAPITIDPSILNPPPITTAPPPVTTQLPVTTPKPAETTKTPETTTTPEPSTEPETDEPVTTAPESNEPTTSAPETQPETTPETTVSDLKPISGTVDGENISSLRIFATYETESIDQEARTLTVKVTFFVESYGLQVGGRTTNYMMVNGQKVKNVHTDRINLPDGSPRTRTVLYEYVTTIEKPDDAPVTLELEYFWNCKLYYSGEYVDYLSVKLDLTA